MSEFSVKQIGVIRAEGEDFRIELLPEYVPALKGLAAFGDIQVVWWFSGCDNAAARGVLTVDAPYTKGPAVLGAFATRSPARPNPIALSCAHITYMDEENGVLGLAYIDANDGSPVLDLKPYTPSLDRVETPCMPDWCAHWPGNVETSGDFDWAAEFNF